MSESLRFYFIVQRDGIDKAMEWEQRTAMIYRMAALHAADSDTTNGAKGMEWAQKYCLAAKDCDLYGP